MNGYIGDRVPLCVDLPEKHALRKGAVYKLLGSDQRGLTGDPLTWDSIPDLKRLELSSTSPLFTKLCAEGANGECTFPSLVELDENLMYNVDDNHQEFEVDTLRVIKLRKGSSGIIHYEYIRQPCVEHSFFENGKKESSSSCVVYLLIDCFPLQITCTNKSYNRISNTHLQGLLGNNREE